MADLNVAMILRFVDKATAPARTALRALERMGGDGMLRQAAAIGRGSRMIGSGLGNITSAALSGAAVLATYHGTLSLIGASFVAQASQFEKFNVQLTNLEGSADGAKRAMTWIEDFATRTPLELEDTVAAYAKLKAFGIDPTNGSLQAMVDTMAATGGSAEQLDGLVLALGQSWTKGKLQGEEAMQMLERGVPVWDLLAQKMGISTAEVMKLSEKGKLGRKEIGLLIDALAEKNAGASAGMAKTWDGVISNIMDQWTRFQRMVMAAGVFDFLKGRLQDLLDLLNQMAADGRLQMWAEKLANAILTSLQALWSFGSGAVSVFNWLLPILQNVADLLGGWDNLGWLATAALMSRSVLRLVVGFWQLGAGIAMVVRALAAAVVANPLLLAIAAIAGMAYVIYQNWDGVVAYFQDKVDRVRKAFDEGLLNGVLKLLAEFNPFRIMTDGAVGLFNYLTGWNFDDITKKLRDAFLAIDFKQMGIDMMNALWEGIKSVLTSLTAWVKTQLESLMPDWVKNLGGGLGGDSGYDGMAGAMDGTFVTGDRALGGPVRRGGIYRWQEEGEEFFSPSIDGRVISNRALRSRGGRSSTPAISIGQISVYGAPGQSAEDIARAVRREMEAAARSRSYALHDGGGYDE